MAVIVSMGALAMGYDTSVIGGTMALDSFRRDFNLINVTRKVNLPLTPLDLTDFV